MSPYASTFKDGTYDGNAGTIQDYRYSNWGRKTMCKFTSNDELAIVNGRFSFTLVPRHGSMLDFTPSTFLVWSKTLHNSMKVTISMLTPVAFQIGAFSYKCYTLEKKNRVPGTVEIPCRN